MAGSQSSSEPHPSHDGDSSSDDFVHRVRDALAHLHDPAYLETHPLARYLPRDQSARRALRQALLEALESLHPGKDSGSLARHSQLLQLRYVEGLDVRDVYDRLAISRTEFYREHQRAIEAIASILRSRWGIAEATGEAADGRRANPPEAAQPRAGASSSAKATRPPNNLPVEMTSFVGREREMAEVRRLLETTRLLTLTGTGGCGKTRLAYQVAADLLASGPEEYPDGVWAVELASLSDPALVPQTAATVLGVREEPGRPILAALADYLRPKRLLLILDNCEHLLDASARLAGNLLHACPEIGVLATSREALGLYGEASYRVPSLSVPDPRERLPLEALERYESVRLLLDRARLVSADFALTEQNAAAVAEICWRLDGIPLALELAIARIRGLTVEGIAKRLDDRFRLLTGGSRTALRRQQTLRAAIDWSYDLLSAAERCLFYRLAVFAGGWSLDAAEEVCSDGADTSEVAIEREDVLDLLLRLVDRSLVVAEAALGEERYHFPETIRQYAMEKLLDSGEAARLRDRHRDWLIDYARQALARGRAAPTDAERGRVVEEAELELDNARAALSWCLETNPTQGLELANAMALFWIARGFAAEGRRWYREVLGRATERTTERAEALHNWATLATDQGDLAEAAAAAEEGLAIAREIGGSKDAVLALVRLALVASLRGDSERSRALYEEAADLGRGAGDPWAAGFALFTLANAYSHEGDYARGRIYLEEAIEAWRASSGLTPGVAYATAHLGYLDQAEGNLELAVSRLESAVESLRKLRDVAALGWSLSLLGYTVCRAGDCERGVSLLRESLLSLKAMGHRPRLGRCLYLLGIVEGARGEHRRSARLIGASTAIVGQGSIEGYLAERLDREASIAAARSALGEEVFGRAWTEGQAMTLEQAVEYALADDISRP